MICVDCVDCVDCFGFWQFNLQEFIFGYQVRPEMFDSLRKNMFHKACEES